MKLASLKNGSRDGRLVIVSRDLTRCTDASFLVPTLQAALDDWRRIAPHLAALSESLDHGAVPSERFHEHNALSPLPRAYQRLHSSASAALQQEASDAFAAPRDSIRLASNGIRVDASCEIAVVVDDVPMGADAGEARDVIRLVMLGNDVSLTTGGLQSRLRSAFSPVAVTPDELGDAWDGGTLTLPLIITLNGKPHLAADGSDNLPALIARAARDRPLAAGSIVGVRATDATAAMVVGDTVRIELKDRKGHSIFGAIEQTVENPQREG